MDGDSREGMLQNGLLLIVCIMPLLAPSLIAWSGGAVNVAPHYFKLAWMAIGVTALLVVWLLQGGVRREQHIVINRFYWPLLGLIAWCFITLFWVENFYLALMALGSLVSSGLLLFLMVQLVVPKRVDRFFWWLSIALLVVSVIGLIQYYGVEVSWLQEFLTQVGRPESTFGNKNFAGHFVVMVLPLALVGLLSSEVKKERLVYSIVVAIGGWYLIYIVARQAYLAVAVEVALLLLFLLLDYRKNRENSLIGRGKQWTVIIRMIAAVLIFLILASNWTVNGQAQEENRKLSKLQDISIESGQNRIAAWRNTIEMVKDYPVAGVGVGQWSVHYPKYYDRIEKDVIYNEQTRLLRLHNDYIQTFAELGLIGYLFLVWMLYIVVRRIFRIVLDVSHPYRWQVLGLSFGLVGFTVVAMFSFPVRLYLPLFLVFLYISMILLFDREIGGGDVVFVNSTRVIYSVAGITLLLLLMVITISPQWLVAENKFWRSKVFEGGEMYQQAVEEGLASVQYNGFNPEYKLRTAANLLMVQRVDEAAILLEQSLDSEPYDPDALVLLSTVYAHRKESEKEKRALERALEIDTHNVLAAAYLVKHHYQNNDSEQASLMYQRLKENYHYFKGRAGFGPYHDYVAQIASTVGDYHYAKYAYEQAIEENPSGDNYAKLATVEYFRLGNQERGVELFKQALKLDPMIKKHMAIRRMIRKYEKTQTQ